MTTPTTTGRMLFVTLPVADGAEDHGYMYSRSFFDLDGHPWQVMWMDPDAGQ